MKKLRIILWAAVFVVGAALSWFAVTGGSARDDAAYGIADIGGPFSGVRSDGKAITEADLAGRPHAIFFGFTHCPDVCPTTLYEASQWLAKLGPEADGLDIYFATVDPERDTAQLLGEYLQAFDSRIRGISGTPEQMAQMDKAYRVYSERVPLGDGSSGDYTMNHTATVYLMRADGSFFGSIAYGEDSDVAVAKLERLLASGT